MPRDQAIRRYEVGAARAEGRRICAEELAAWHKEREQAAAHLRKIEEFVVMLHAYGRAMMWIEEHYA